MSTDERAAKAPHVPVVAYFTGLAALYAEHRPTYPAAALGWIAGHAPARARAADVGCGTGISTRLLATAGLRVIGIDPNGDMLAAAIGEAPGSSGPHYCAGAAEALPLRGGAVSLVVCAQAFHWFEPAAALAEFHRVLTPRGHVATMWNTPDPDDTAAAWYARIASRARTMAQAAGRITRTEREADLTPGGWFVRPERRVFPNPHRLDRDGLLGRARSSSYWPREVAAAEELERELLALFAAHQRDGSFTLRQLAVITVAQRATVR